MGKNVSACANILFPPTKVPTQQKLAGPKRKGNTCYDTITRHKFDIKLLGIGKPLTPNNKYGSLRGEPSLCDSFCLTN